MSGNWLERVFSSTVGSFAEKIAGIVDRFVQSPDEKAALMLELERLMQLRDAELEQTLRRELEAKERIIVAELQSGDNFARRARPMMAYFGMFVIFINYVLLPWIGYFNSGEIPPAFEMPEPFWYAWGGVTASWFIGRTMERRGSQSELTKIVTGEPRTIPSLIG